MYRAGEEGDRPGVLRASNELTKAVGGFRKLLDARREREREVTQRELFELLDDLADGLNHIFRRHEVKPEAIRDMLNCITRTPGTGTTAETGHRPHHPARDLTIRTTTSR